MADSSISLTNGRVQQFRTRTTLPRGREMLRRKQKSMRLRREQTPPKRAIDKANGGSSVQRPLSVSTMASGVSSNRSVNDTSTRRSSAATDYSVPMVTQTGPAGQRQETNISDCASTNCQTPVNEQRKAKHQIEKVIEEATVTGNDSSTCKMNDQEKEYHGDFAGISGKIEGTTWRYDKEFNAEDLEITKETEAVEAADVKLGKSLITLEINSKNEDGNEDRNRGCGRRENFDGSGDVFKGDGFEGWVEMASPNSEIGIAHITEPEKPPRKPPSPRSHISQQQKQQRGLAISNPFRGGLLETFLTQDDSSEGEENSPPSKITSKLQSARIDVFRLREEHRRMREELRSKEKVKIASDEAFMKYVRENMQVPALLGGYRDVVPSLFSQLDQYFAAMQTARDEYGPLDDKYNTLFDTLDDKEFEMTRIEGRVYKQKPTEETPLGSSKAASSSADSLRDMSWEEKYHPLHFNYLSRLGDLELAVEDYDDMKHALDNLLYQQDLKATSNESLDPDSKATMEQLLAQQAALQSKIAGIEADVESLRVQCLAEGIDLQPRTISSVTSESSSGEVREVPLPDANNLHMSLDASIPQKEEASHDSHSMFHLLSPSPGGGKDKLFRDLITEFDEDNKSDRINRWLLHGLQTSPLALDLLVQVFLGVVNILDLNKWQTGIFHWQCSVLSEWTRDEANIPAEAFNLAITKSSLSHVSKEFTNSSPAKRFDYSSDQYKGSNVMYPKLLLRNWKSAPAGLGAGFGRRSDDMRKHIV